MEYGLVGLREGADHVALAVGQALLVDSKVEKADQLGYLPEVVLEANREADLVGCVGKPCVVCDLVGAGLALGAGPSAGRVLVAVDVIRIDGVAALTEAKLHPASHDGLDDGVEGGCVVDVDPVLSGPVAHGADDGGVGEVGVIRSPVLAGARTEVADDNVALGLQAADDARGGVEQVKVDGCLVALHKGFVLALIRAVGTGCHVHPQHVRRELSRGIGGSGGGSSCALCGSWRGSSGGCRSCS